MITRPVRATPSATLSSLAACARAGFVVVDRAAPEASQYSRIREYWLQYRRQKPTAKEAHAANDEAVAHGVARTGRVITAAALVMSMSFAALIAAHVSFMRMFGLGLTLAVFADATLVRMVLVPAFMHVMGRWNWWAPKPLVWLHERFGISEGPAEETGYVESTEEPLQHNGYPITESVTKIG